ncbi:Acyltransferase family protein [compost metagenome]
MFFTGTTITPFGTESKMEVATLSGLFTHLFFVHGLIPEHESSILSVAWSLSLEMQFYVLFPLLFVVIFKKLKPAQSLLLLVLFTIISEVLLKYMLFGHQPAMILFKLPLFMLGMIVAAYGLGKIDKKYFLLGLLIIVPFQARFTILLFAVILLFLLIDSFESKIPSLIYRPLNAIKRLLSSRFSGFGADISYSLYLLHLIILPFILRFYMGLTDNKMLVAGYSLISFLIINVILSYVLHQTVEKRFIVIVRNIVNKGTFNMNHKKRNTVNYEERI